MSASRNLWHTNKKTVIRWIGQDERAATEEAQNRPIAQLLALAPRQIRLEQCVVAVQLLAVELARALLRAVLLVRREQRVERQERGLRRLDAHRAAAGAAVPHHRVQVHRPKADVRFAQLADVGEQPVLVDIGEDVLRLDGLQAGEEQLRTICISADPAAIRLHRKHSHRSPFAAHGCTPPRW